jgi:predicted nucleic acid-binding protein
MEIVFDTFAWVEYFEDSKKAGVVEEYLENSNVYTPWIVLLELSYKADKEKWDFEKIFKFIKLRSKIVGVSEDFVLSFGKLYNGIKKEIKGIGAADIIILNSARFLNAKILTGDKHFGDFSDAILL